MIRTHNQPYGLFVLAIGVLCLLGTLVPFSADAKSGLINDPENQDMYNQYFNVLNVRSRDQADRSNSNGRPSAPRGYYEDMDDDWTNPDPSEDDMNWDDLADDPTENPVTPVSDSGRFAENVFNRFFTMDRVGQQPPVFDVRAFVSDICFNPAQVEWDTCKNEFGPYADLRTLLDNRMLMDIVKIHAPDADVVLMLEALEAELRLRNQGNMNTDTEDDADREREERDRRAARVWARCQAMHAGRSSDDETDDEAHRLSAQCYIRNQRLVEDMTIRFEDEDIQ